MQFKYPELLYALFLLVIPIIVHLFQLRKFKKVAFTNVAFLKNVNIKTRKSAQLKKWLTLITRMLLFAALIFAFAQPYFSKNNSLDIANENVIYLDNSFSMQAKGDKGALLKRAIQDIITNIPEDKNISILTNSKVFKNTTINAIKNELLQLPYTTNTLSLKSVVLKSKRFFSKNNNTIKNLILISDFQNSTENFNINKDSLLNIYAVKLSPTTTENILIDSAYIASTSPTKLELSVSLKNTGNKIENLPISLFNNENLIAKTSTALDKKASVMFELPNNKIINGEVKIGDRNLQFDNTLFFNINATEKVNVLAIGDIDYGFLKRIYTGDEFEFKSSTIKNLDYNILNQQHLIILNELEHIPNALATVLNSFTSDNGALIVIPNTNAAIESYNNFLSRYNISLKSKISSKKRITTINYSHPLYDTGVFEKRITNFQYPKVESFYKLNANVPAILSFEDGTPFLISKQNTFVLTAAINIKNSNFTQSPLIVPTLYNIGKYSYKIPKLYYAIGTKNTFEVKVDMQPDGVLSLENNTEKLIPRQQTFSNKVEISTENTPSTAGIYNITNATTVIKNVSYNYSRAESDLTYQNLENIEHLKTSNSIDTLFDALKSDTKINALWKWFVIFALILLLTEMLILKYFK